MSPLKQYSEIQWMQNTMTSVPDFEYDGGADYSHSTKHQGLQAPLQSTPTSRRSPGIGLSLVPPHLLEGDRPKSSPGVYNINDSGDVSPNQQPHNQQHHHQPQHHNQQSSHDDPSRYSMSSYTYLSTSLPLSTPTSTTAYPAQDIGQTMTGNLSAIRIKLVPIAPNPADLRGNKRKRQMSIPEHPPELTEEEKLQLKLKKDENLPWKDIAMRFQQDIGKTYQVPALQMRFKRLRERICVRTENDRSDMLTSTERSKRSGSPLQERSTSQVQLAPRSSELPHVRSPMTFIGPDGLPNFGTIGPRAPMPGSSYSAASLWTNSSSLRLPPQQPLQQQQQH